MIWINETIFNELKNRPAFYCPECRNIQYGILEPKCVHIKYNWDDLLRLHENGRLIFLDLDGLMFGRRYASVLKH